MSKYKYTNDLPQQCLLVEAATIAAQSKHISTSNAYEIAREIWSLYFREEKNKITQVQSQ